MMFSDGDGEVVEEASVQLPPTVWVLRYGLPPRGALEASWLFCAPTRVADVQSQVLVTPFPFGNVYVETGKICWGEVTTSLLTSRDPLAVDNLFFGSQFNGDLTNWRAVILRGQQNDGGRSAWLRWQAQHSEEVAQVAPGEQRFQQMLRSICGGGEAP